MKNISITAIALPLFVMLLFFSNCIPKEPFQKTSTIESVRNRLRDSILNLIKAPIIPSNSMSILDFGAVADSVTDCKPAFDKAIMECKNRKGGKIIVPEGVYYIDGPIHLANNVCLFLDKGARIKFSSNPKSYLPVVKTSWEGTFIYNYSPFIYGYQLQDVSIIGEGTIDGFSKNTFQQWADIQETDLKLTRKMNHGNIPLKDRIFGDGHFLRPQLIQFFECKNILIEGITITDSPFWCIHLLKSENAIIRKVKYNAHNRNNDGIDPEYSKNILIEDISFDNGDDNVAIKAGRDHEGRTTAVPSENILIRNCKFKGLHGVVIGSEMSAGVKNVVIENCGNAGYCKRAFYIKSNPDRGGYVKNIYVHNLVFDKVEDCLFFTSYYKGEGKGFNSEIYNIYIDSVFCNKASNAGIVIQGFPLKKVRDVYLSNIMIDTASTGISFTNAENIVMDEVNIGGIVKIPSSVK